MSLTDMITEEENKIRKLKDTLDQNIELLSNYEKEVERRELNNKSRKRRKGKLKIRKLNDKLACEFCEYKSNRKAYLDAHTRLHTGEQRFHCDQCDFKNNNKTKFQIHKRKHTGVKPFKCDQCDYTCSTKADLNKHIGFVHNKSFECAYCGQKCGSKSYLNLHIKTHTGDEPFHCDQCDYKTN